MIPKSTPTPHHNPTGNICRNVSVVTNMFLYRKVISCEMDFARHFSDPKLSNWVYSIKTRCNCTQWLFNVNQFCILRITKECRVS